MVREIDYHGTRKDFHILESRIKPFERFCERNGITEDWEKYDIFDFWQMMHDTEDECGIGTIDDQFMRSDGEKVTIWGYFEGEYGLDEEERFWNEYKEYMEIPEWW